MVKPEGVSAVKAITIAAAQGQKIFTITQANAAVALPQLQQRASVMEEVQNAINAGKEVTISQGQVSVSGWTGTGYIIVDPQTGAGAYMIEGGANGGFTDTLSFINNFMAYGAIPWTQVKAILLLSKDVADSLSKTLGNFGSLFGFIADTIDIAFKCQGADFVAVYAAYIFPALFAFAFAAAFPMLAGVIASMAANFFMSQYKDFLIQYRCGQK